MKKINGGPGAIRTPDPQIRSLTAGFESKGKIAQLAWKNSISDQGSTISVQTKKELEKENPGSAATETGTEYEVWLDWIDNNLKREQSARVLARAVADCEPEDRLPFLETLIEGLCQGCPLPPFMGIMASARDWAARACRAELKAYALACYEAMTAKDQAAFLGHLDRRAAAWTAIAPRVCAPATESARQPPIYWP